MKETKLILVCAAVCMLCSLPSYASSDTVLLSEDFEGTVGANLTTKGWTQYKTTSTFFSNNIIDDGMSGAGGFGGLSYYGKNITPYTLQVNEYFQLTMTVQVTYDLMSDTGTYVGFEFYGYPEPGHPVPVHQYGIDVGGNDQWGEAEDYVVGWNWPGEGDSDFGTYYPIGGTTQELKMILDGSGGTMWRRLPGQEWQEIYSSSNPITQALSLRLRWYWDDSECTTPPYIDSVELAVKTRLMGDVDLDGAVNLSDLTILTDNYGLTSGATWSMGDFNGDEAVNLSDLTILTDNYGSTGSGISPAPEPTTAGILALSGCYALLRRKIRK